MIKTAAILAAGRGTRIKKKTDGKPKGFLSVCNESIIEQSIHKLICCGIERIIIGTGYMHEYYDILAENNHLLSCFYNERYADSGSMYTLYNLKNLLLGKDFLLLESDLIYESNSLKVLINELNANVILSSGETGSGDEVYIEVDDNLNLVNMSKQPAKLNNIYGELVGITKLSSKAYEEMCYYAEKAFQDNLSIDYEQALVEISKITKVKVKRIKDLAWCEIDNESHLDRAINIISPKIAERESMLSVKRNVLLNPGPATTTDSVKYAQIVPDICPREKEFGDIMKFISDELTNIVANKNNYASILFGGSGTAAVESILSSVISENDCVLIINNGAYGNRMCEISNAYNINYLEYKSSQSCEVNFEDLELTIRNAMMPITHVAVVHNETTTGLLTNIGEIGSICCNYNLVLIVDAVSSFAALPISMPDMNIHYLAASSNKNIQGMAGISFVVAKKESLLKSQTIKPRNYYLNLHSQYQYFENNHQMRFTPPVQVLYALRQAIIEAKREGIQNRYLRYSESWETLINGLAKLGLKCTVPEKYQSKIITSIIQPDNPNYSFESMHAFFLKKGFTIYPGKIDESRTFRVANIGDIGEKDIEVFINLLSEYLETI